MMEVKGLKELNIKLNVLSKEAEKVVQEELADIALDLGAKASQSAPVDKGDLRGELANPQKEGKEWLVGASLPYTRYQHEGTHLSHPKGGGAKFLEKPFRANVDKYINEIGKAIERNLK